MSVAKALTSEAACAKLKFKGAPTGGVEMRSIMLAVSIIAVSTAAQALTPAQLTKQEGAKYQTLKTNPTAARSYLDTRGFVRQCEKVVRHQMAAIDLPVQPKDYNSNYVTGPEQKTVDNAINLNVAALINGISRKKK